MQASSGAQSDRVLKRFRWRLRRGSAAEIQFALLNHLVKISVKAFPFRIPGFVALKPVSLHLPLPSAWFGAGNTCQFGHSPWNESPSAI